MTNKAFSRTHIAGDRPIPPYELQGVRRVIFLMLYGMILGTAVAAIAYVFYFRPLFGVTALAFGYLFDNLAFAYGHFEFHTEFIEIPEERMPTLCHNAFIHHYRNRRVFHERWLETRISYFVDAQSGTTVVLLKCFAVAAFMLALWRYVDPLLAMGWFAALAAPLLVQSVIHEWYHYPANDRKHFYTPPVYWFFVLLEKAGIASTKDHMTHHLHDLESLDRVTKWLDLNVPFGERLPQMLWKKALARYTPGQTGMNDFARRLGTGVFLVANRPLLTVLIAASYRLGGP